MKPENRHRKSATPTTAVDGRQPSSPNTCRYTLGQGNTVTNYSTVAALSLLAAIVLQTLTDLLFALAAVSLGVIVTRAARQQTDRAMNPRPLDSLPTAPLPIVRSAGLGLVFIGLIAVCLFSSPDGSKLVDRRPLL